MENNSSESIEIYTEIIKSVAFTTVFKHGPEGLLVGELVRGLDDGAEQSGTGQHHVAQAIPVRLVGGEERGEEEEETGWRRDEQKTENMKEYKRKMRPWHITYNQQINKRKQYLQDALHSVGLDAAAVDWEAVLHRRKLVVHAVLTHLQKIVNLCVSVSVSVSVRVREQLSDR